MVAISMGVCTYYTNLRNIGEDLKTVRPTVMASAPRLWENLYQKLMARIDEAPPLRRGLFHAARFCTCHVKRAESYFRGQELDTQWPRAVSNAARAAVAHFFRWIALYVPYRISGQRSSSPNFGRPSDAGISGAQFPAEERFNRMWMNSSILLAYPSSRAMG